MKEPGNEVSKTQYSHYTTACIVQLMRPDIGRNASCNVWLYIPSRPFLGRCGSHWLFMHSTHTTHHVHPYIAKHYPNSHVLKQAHTRKKACATKLCTHTHTPHTHTCTHGHIHMYTLTHTHTQAPVIGSHEYAVWREGGVTFHLRDDAPYESTNRTLASGTILTKVMLPFLLVKS